MLGRSTEDEMARIAERGNQHATAAWLHIANHAEQPEQQLHAHQQARVMNLAWMANLDDDEFSSVRSDDSAHHALGIMI